MVTYRYFGSQEIISNCYQKRSRQYRRIAKPKNKKDLWSLIGMLGLMDKKVQPTSPSK